MTRKPNTQNERDHGDGTDEGNFETPEKVRRKWFDVLFKNKAGMWTAIFTGVLSVFTYFL